MQIFCAKLIIIVTALLKNILISGLKFGEHELVMEFQAINDDAHYDSIKMTTLHGMIFSHKTNSEDFKNYKPVAESFISKVHSQLMDFDYVDLPIYELDCAKQHAEQLCLKEDDFLILTLFEGNRTFQITMSPKIEHPSESQYFKTIFAFYSHSWKNFYKVKNGADDLKSVLTMDKKWMLCYGDFFHPLGKNFCYQLGSVYKKNPEVAFAFVDNKESLSDINEYFKLNLDVNAIVPMLGLWYLNCVFTQDLQLNVKEPCSVWEYWGDDVLENVQLFFKLLFVDNLDAMRKRGSVKKFGEIPGPILFYFHTNSTKKLAREGGKKLADKLRGFAFVATVNVDFVHPDFLTKIMSLNLDEIRNGKIVYKLWPRSPSFPNTKIHQLLPIENDQDHVKFMQDFYSKAFDLESIYRTVLLHSGDKVSFNAINGSRRPKIFKNNLRIIFFNIEVTNADSTVQDDEVEVLLHAFKKVDCPTCMPDMQNVEILNKSNINLWHNSKSIRIILYWLNVDTISKAALHVFAKASDIVPLEHKVFGAVACHDWPKICKNAGFMEYPKILIYKNEKLLKIYDGVLDVDALANTAVLVSEPDSIQLKNERDLEQYINGQYLKMSNDKYLPICTIGFFQSKDDIMLKPYLEAGKKLHGKYLLAWSLEPLLTNGLFKNEKFQLTLATEKAPKIFTIKNNDHIQPLVKMDNEQYDAKSVINFVEKSSRPKLLYFTQLSFPAIIKSPLPLLILVAHEVDTSGNLYNQLLNAKECLKDNLICAILNGLYEQALFIRLRDKWHLQDNVENLIYLNYTLGVLYTYDQEKNLPLKDWLENIYNGKLEPHGHLPKYEMPERPLMFNYLTYGKKKQQEDTKDSKFVAQNVKTTEPPESTKHKTEL